MNARLPADARSAACARSRRGLAAALLMLLSMLPATAQAAADSDAQLALKVKAALLYNLVKFVSWPPSKLPGPDAPLRLCVLELVPEPLAATVDDTVRGKSVDGHPLVSYRSSRAADLRDCHLIYAAGGDEPRLRAALAALAGSGALLVHEHGETLSEGAVRLLVVDRKLRFEINVDAAERENLQLSSKLLSLSLVVHR